MPDSNITPVLFSTNGEVFALIDPRPFFAAGTGSFQYFRWTVTATRGSAGTQISEFQLMNGTSSLNWAGGTSASSAGGTHPGGETPTQAIDNNIFSKMGDYAIGFGATASVLFINAPDPITFTGYRYVTGNDFDTRDPISWTLEASNSSSSGWILIDTRTSVSITFSRRVATDTYSISIPSPQANIFVTG